MKRRTKEQLISDVIAALDAKELSVNEIAREIRANWSTVNDVLTLLKKLGIAKETVTTPKIRLFKLTGKKKRFS